MGKTGNHWPLKRNKKIRSPLFNSGLEGSGQGSQAEVHPHLFIPNLREEIFSVRIQPPVSRREVYEALPRGQGSTLKEK